MAKSVYARFGTSAITGTNQIVRQHTVLAGDTIPKIAAYWEPTLGYSSEFWRQICENSSNNITDLDALTVGTVLVIPTPQAPST